MTPTMHRYDRYEDRVTLKVVRNIWRLTTTARRAPRISIAPMAPGEPKATVEWFTPGRKRR